MHAMTASLRLVFPPISNQHADWLVEDTAARQRLDQANIYMIAARAQIAFRNVVFDDATAVMSFDIGFSDLNIPARIYVRDLIEELSANTTGGVDIRGGEGYIQFADNLDNGTMQVLAWYTPDKFLFDVWRGYRFVEMDGDHRQLARYELLYIGMSQDSAFRRLVEKPHHARLKILTNELVRGAEGRLSEELFFFLFDVEPLFISTYGEEDEIDDIAVEMMMDPSKRIPNAALIEDAEKAFIKMLNTPYNKRRYHNYPAVANGLSETVLERYGYSIAEDVAFTLEGLEFVGGYAEGLPCSNEADFIFVDGQTASFVDISEKRLTEMDGPADEGEGDPGDAIHES